MTENKIRINKFISSNGILSRRKADEFILQGRITVNGITISEPGYRITPETDKVRIDGELLKISTKKVYILLNKPLRTICSVSDEKKRMTVIDLIKSKDKIFPVGRLDYDTSGLLILTNDGDFANQLMHPKFKIYKTYFVKISKPLEEKYKAALMKGVLIDNKRTEPCTINFASPKDKQSLFISIREGRNRQVRKMFEKQGYFVRRLHRVEYGNLKLNDLPDGKWRNLTAKEIEGLISLINKKDN
ncbi:MAG TPA: pseudouridine synthase [Ignavibacteria bacterium]